MKDQIDQTIRRTRSYWNVDGLPELGFGLLCLLLAGYFTVQSALPSDSLLYQVLNIAFILIIIGGSLLSNRLVSYLKRKFTYPRTGYVAYQQPSQPRRILVGLVAAVTSGILGAVFEVSRAYVIQFHDDGAGMDRETLRHAFERAELESENLRLRATVVDRYEIVGESAAIRELKEVIGRVTSGSLTARAILCWSASQNEVSNPR